MGFLLKYSLVKLPAAGSETRSQIVSVLLDKIRPVVTSVEYTRQN